MADRQLDILIGGKDVGAGALVDGLSRKVTGLGDSLRKVGDVSDINVAKKLGKTIQDVVNANDTTDIKKSADESRTASAVKLHERYRELNEELEKGNVTALRAQGIELDRARALETYRKEQRAINAEEAAATSQKERGGALVRGAAIAGGFLGLVKVAGDVANAVDRVNQKIEKGEASVAEYPAEIAKSLPIIGSVVQAAEDLGNVWSGNAAFLREVTAEAKRTAEAVQKIRKNDADIAETVKKSRELNESPTQRVNREAADRLAEIEKERADLRATGRGGKGSEQEAKLDEAVRQIRIKRERDLAEIEQQARQQQLDRQKRFNDQAEAADRAASEDRADIAVAAMREQGRQLDATLAEIDRRTNARLGDIAKRRGELATSDAGPAERIAIGQALDREAQAVRDRQQTEVATARKSAGEAAAERVQKIEKDTLAIQAEGGDRVAQRELKRLEVLERVQAREKEIRDTIAAGVTPEQRKRLEEQLAGLGDEVTKQLAAVDRRLDVTVQGRERAAAVDGRYQANALAQSREVTVLRDTQKAQQDTAANTKAIADSQKRVEEALTEFLRRVRPVR